MQVTKLAVGDVITFSFENNARRDLPVSPRIYRIRTDVSWDDVVHSYVKERQYLTGMFEVEWEKERESIEEEGRGERGEGRGERGEGRGASKRHER